MTRRLFAWIAAPAAVMAALLTAGPAGAQPGFRGMPPPAVGRGWLPPGAIFVSGPRPSYWRSYYCWHYVRPLYIWENYYPYYGDSADSYDSYLSTPYDGAPSDGADPYGRTYIRSGSLAALCAPGSSYRPALSSLVPGEEGPF
jgi:hypothetical protein